MLGEMMHGWVAADPARVTYQDMIRAIPYEVPYTAISNASHLTLSDEIHLDAAAHIEMGLRYSTQFHMTINNSTPGNFTTPSSGEHLLYNVNSNSGLTFPYIFSAVRYGNHPMDDLYSLFGDIWKYKNQNEFSHFKLEVVTGSGMERGIFE